MRYLYIALAISLIGPQAHAAIFNPSENLPWLMTDCAQNADAKTTVPRTVSGTVSRDPVSDVQFRDPAFTVQYLDELKTRVYTFCQAMKPDAIYGNMKQSKISFLEFQRKGDISARYDFNGGRWVRLENRIADRYAQAELDRQRDEFDRRQKEDKKRDDDRKAEELRRRLQELGQAFRDDHQGVVLTSPDRVSVNPFVHLHRLVAVHAHFDRMLSADTASFGGFFSRVVLYGVPTDRFVDPQQEALIVFQLDEVTPPDELPRGRNLLEEGVVQFLKSEQRPTLEGRYVDALDCSKTDCRFFEQEILRQRTAAKD